MKITQFAPLKTISTVLFAVLLFGCAPVTSPPPLLENPTVSAVPENREVIEQTTSIDHIEPVSQQNTTLQTGGLPIRFQQPFYTLRERIEIVAIGAEQDITIPVGADISSTVGPVALRDILKRLAVLKNMNISWASDVDQFALVDVDIRAEDDFFQAITNILRQIDYFHEVKGNTIVVKYRETRTFQIAMPFLSSTYSIGVGGDVLGAGGGAGVGANALVGKVLLTSDNNEFDIWANIRKNLDQILGIWEETIVVPTGQIQAGMPGEEPAVISTRNVRGAKGHYTIDLPIGMITVTAPRPLVEKIATYLDNLGSQLFRQIVIEAKIIEIELGDTERKGINWRNLLDTSVDLELFGAAGIIYSPGVTLPRASKRLVSQLALPDTDNPFNILISALETQGTARLLSNPKISVLNGQPALISVGTTFGYIKEVETTVVEGVVSTSVETGTVMSGLGMSVIAIITEDDEIVLSLTPVTSKVVEIAEETFQGLTIQLPEINIKQMNTIVRVKDGDMLMIGGLIDTTERTTINKVPVLGSMPGISRFFSHEEKTKVKKELVILLQPRII